MARIPGADPLLILAVVLVAGAGLGALARRVRLPGVTGQILAGVLIGPSVLALFDRHDVEGLAPLTDFALALIGVTVGAHLNVQQLRNAGRRLAWLAACEVLLVPASVMLAVLAFSHAPPIVALLLGAIAVETAPATVLSLVRESRAKGVFVKTLVGAVVLNNIATIFLFELARGAGRLGVEAGSLSEVSLGAVFASSALELGQALAIGAVLAVLSHAVTRRVRLEHAATVSAITLLLVYGLASSLGVSALAASLALGVVQTNLSPLRDRLATAVFADFEPVILCVFFTLAGMHLQIGHGGAAGLLALLVVAARGAAKLGASAAAMRLAGATEALKRHLGPALLPQAGLAVGLVLLVQEEPAFAHFQALFTAAVLTAVTVNEVIGPIATRISLQRSGEVGRDRPRLVDFLQEEHIATDLEARSMEDAIAKLVDLLIRSHHLQDVDRKALQRSVLEREAQVSTCLGEGLAVPHGDLPEGHSMVGVMGLSRRGLPFDTPDGRPVHCVVLLATPAGERDRHLEVLAALARTVGGDPTIQRALYQARSAAHAYEILHGEETEDFNYFLEDD